MEIIFEGCGDHTRKTEHGEMPQKQSVTNLPDQVMKDALHIHCNYCGCIKAVERCSYLDKEAPEKDQPKSDLVHFSISWPGSVADDICQVQGSLPPDQAYSVIKAIAEPSHPSLKMNSTGGVLDFIDQCEDLGWFSAEKAAEMRKRFSR